MRKNKRNLFTFATKELTQDAFLRWFFENYDDKDVEKAVYALLRDWCNFSDDEIIKDLSTTAQWNFIDISIWIETNKRKVALFIEDKTFSSESNQLTEYNKHIQKYQKDHTDDIYCIFYKTSLIDEEESDRIRKANIANISWREINIEEAYKTFSPFVNSGNVILKQYIEHLAELYSASNNKEKPMKSDSKLDLVSWESYFKKVVIPQIEKDNRIWCDAWGAKQYPYVYLFIKKQGYGDRKIPYLEVRSRDCQDNKFVARVLCYGVTEDDLRKQQGKLIDNIKNSRFLCKNLKTKKNGTPIFPKQVGFTDRIDVCTNDDFINQTKYWIEEYLKIMEDWE